MLPRTAQLKNGNVLVVREARPEDARALLPYLEEVGGESDFLSFGSGEFDLTEPQEEEFIRQCHDADNQLFLVGVIGDRIVATLTFLAGHRPRVRHSGEMGMSVRRECWGIGVGSQMLDALIDWARASKIITKINLRVRIDNQRAIDLYRRQGFVHEGTISREMLLRGAYFGHHWMGLEL